MHNCEDHDPNGISSRRLANATMIVGVIFFAKLAGGYYFNSLALLSDAWHLLTDILALGLSWVALLQARRPANQYNTFGFHRYGVMAALINNLTLLGISIYIFLEAYPRLFQPQPVGSIGMMLLAVFGILANGLIILILQEGEQNLNIKSALLHFVGDALASVSIVIGGIIIHFTGWSVVDPILSIIIGLLIVKSAWEMTWEALHILAEGAPKTVNQQEVIQEVLSISGIKGLSDLHLWCLSNEVVSCTLHIEVGNVTVQEGEVIICRVQDALRERFGIVHSTIQMESGPCRTCYHQRMGVLGCHLCTGRGVPVVGRGQCSSSRKLLAD